MTVLLCDIVGSAALSISADPEDAQELIAGVLDQCAMIVERNDGVVARFTGDGLLAYFGYPVAVEGDAERAVRAGYAIAALGDSSDTRLAGPKLRVGVATGPVMVGRVLQAGFAQEHAVFGEAPNLAARLQAAAPAGGVLVADLTRQLTRGSITYEDAGELLHSGFGDRRRAWLATSLGPTDEGARPETPLVGRDSELKLIADAWRACRLGRGKAIGIIGDAGLGKSRLLSEAMAQISKPGVSTLKARARAMSSGSPLHPFANALPFVALGPPPTTSDEADEAIAARRSTWLDEVVDALLSLASAGPALIVLDDLHWADRTTVEVLERLTGRLDEAPLLLLWSARPGEGAALQVSPGVSLLELAPLPESSVRCLAALLCPSLTERDLGLMLKRAQGVPLFVEELAHLLEALPGAAAAERLPATLSELLTARLDRLGPARSTAQAAAALGCSFPEGLLFATVGQDIADLSDHLHRLDAAGILHASNGQFVFSHALLQEAAYLGLLRARRRALHQRAAENLAAADQPELALVAQHWAAGEFWDKALEAWRAAAAHALASGAYGEAEQALAAAVAALDRANDPSLHQLHEPSLTRGWVNSLQVTRGYSAPETKAAHDRLASLGRSPTGGPRTADVARSWIIASSAGDHEAALVLATELKDRAGRSGREAAVAFACMALTTTHSRMGDLAAAETAFAEGEPLFLGEAFWTGPGAAPQAFGNGSLTAWLRGDDAQAARRARLCLQLGLRSGDAYTVVFGAQMCGLHAALAGRYRRAERLATFALEAAVRRGFPQFTGISRTVLGRARFGQGATTDGIDLVRQGLEEMQRSGSATGRTLDLVWLAQMLADTGARRAALDVVEDALWLNPSERFVRPDALLLRGRLRGGAEGAADVRLAAVEAARMGAGRAQARALNMLGPVPVTARRS